MPPDQGRDDGPGPPAPPRRRGLPDYLYRRRNTGPVGRAIGLGLMLGVLMLLAIAWFGR